MVNASDRNSRRGQSSALCLSSWAECPPLCKASPLRCWNGLLVWGCPLLVLCLVSVRKPQRTKICHLPKQRASSSTSSWEKDASAYAEEYWTLPPSMDTPWKNIFTSSCSSLSALKPHFRGLGKLHSCEWSFSFPHCMCCLSCSVWAALEEKTTHEYIISCPVLCRIFFFKKTSRDSSQMYIFVCVLSVSFAKLKLDPVLDKEKELLWTSTRVMI